MGLSNNNATQKLWEHEFDFTYCVKITTNQLFLKASVENKGEKDFELTFCFHTYLRVPKIADALVNGKILLLKRVGIAIFLGLISKQRISDGN